MDTAYTWLLLAFIMALIYLGIQFYVRRRLTLKRVVETFLLFLLVFTVGFGSLWAFLGHAFFPGQTASYIGWAPGSPFQLEVAFANLAFAFMGLACFWIRGNFWVATVMGVSVFDLGAAYVHIGNMFSTANYSPGNAGAALILDILIPFFLIGLLLAYKFLEKRTARGAIKSLDKSL